jgi:hypothetical protein
MVLQRSTRSLRFANLSLPGSRASTSSTHSRSYLDAAAARVRSRLQKNMSEEITHGKLNICKAFAQLRILVADNSHTGHPRLRFGPRCVWFACAVLAVRVRVPRDNTTRSALCADDAFEKYTQILFATRKIQTSDEYSTFRITYTASDGVRPESAAHVQRIVKGGNPISCSLVGGKLRVIRKDNVDRDGICFCVQLVLYERYPLLVMGA